MPEFSGLQIEVRCVRCGRLPTADVTLYEMQNHLYICHTCRQEAEQTGKRIAWVDGAQMQSQLPATPSFPFPKANSPARARPLLINLPPDSVWAKLNLPLDTPFTKIKQTVREQLQVWSKKPDSAEKRARLALLNDCMEQLQDEEAFEEERERLRVIARKEGSALLVGGQTVLTARDFLEACEATQEGWENGEHYLSTGELSQWILFQLGERELAKEARRYKDQAEVSDFRALNEMLYCLVPARPFRLYQSEAWQKLDTIPSAETPQELATLCDLHWESALLHLYKGSMVYWLAHSRGIQEMQAYYEAAVAFYANDWQDCGVGLELLLERAVPTLKKPQLVVDLDDSRGFYSLKNWDREIPHEAIRVTIANVTRGFTSLDIALQGNLDSSEPDWIYLHSSTSLRGRPGAGMPASASLALDSLERLKRGKRYRRKLYMRVRGENGQIKEQAFPIELRTLSFLRGIRGRLWAWGLRGNIPGLLWNAAAGALLGLFLLWFIPAIAPSTYSDWANQVNSDLSLGNILQASVAGLVNSLRFDALIPGHSFPLAFPLTVAALLGFVGFWVGLGKGHNDYSERQNAAVFRKSAGWLSVCYVLYLLYPDGGYSTIRTAFQYGGYSGYSGSYRNYLIVNAVQYGISTLLLWLAIFFVVCMLAFIHYRIEKAVRYRNRAMLNPLGRL